jgi:hypothetical protein
MSVTDRRPGAHVRGARPVSELLFIARVSR